MAGVVFHGPERHLREEITSSQSWTTCLGWQGWGQASFYISSHCSPPLFWEFSSGKEGLGGWVPERETEEACFALRPLAPLVLCPQSAQQTGWPGRSSLCSSAWPASQAPGRYLRESGTRVPGQALPLVRASRSSLPPQFSQGQVTDCQCHRDAWSSTLPVWSFWKCLGPEDT